MVWFLTRWQEQKRDNLHPKSQFHCQFDIEIFSLNIITKTQRKIKIIGINILKRQRKELITNGEDVNSNSKGRN